MRGPSETVMLFIKEANVFCSLLLCGHKKAQMPPQSSNPFCLLGRLNLIMMHTLEFAGREGLALFDLSL